MTRPLPHRLAWMSFRALLTVAVTALIVVQPGASEPAEMGIGAQRADAEEGCVPIDNALSGNTAQAVICAPYLPVDQREVFGILPDGAANLTARMTDGSSRRVDVINNAYLIRTTVPDPLPVTVSWDDAAGHHEIDSTMPGDANATKCASLEKLKEAAAQAPAG